MVWPVKAPAGSRPPHAALQIACTVPVPPATTVVVGGATVVVVVELVVVELVVVVPATGGRDAFASMAAPVPRFACHAQAAVEPTPTRPARAPKNCRRDGCGAFIDFAA